MQDLIRKRDGKAFWIAIAVLVLTLASFVGWAYRNAAAEAEKKKAPATSANLGQAPTTEAFNQSYQAKLEEMVGQRMQKFQEEQAKQQQAAADQQKATMERIEAMARDAAGRMAAPTPGASSAGDRPPGAADPPPTGYKPTKVYAMADPTAGASGAAETFLGTPGDVVGSGSREGAPAGAGTTPTKPARDAYLIPEAGWVKGRLINGVIGAQGSDFRYTEIKLAGDYHGPNHYVQNVDGCVVTGEASASLWERRFQIKPIGLSCTLPNRRNKTWKTSGYVVDAQDGIQGVNATLVNNEDRKVAASLAAGALERAGAYSSQREVTSAFAPGTGVASGVVTGSAGKYLAGGMVEGAGKTLQGEVKEYYDLFRSTLQVGGGGEVTVHLTSTLELPEGGEAISTIKAAR